MRAAVSLAALLLPCAAFAQDAADEHYDAERMQAAREALYGSHGGGTHWMVFGERLEMQHEDGDSEVVWEAQAWLGGDLNKLWFKTEGEFVTDGQDFEEVELQALYSRAVRPFWDLQLGLRHDIEPGPTRTYGTLGLHGMAPYGFELDAALFLSDEGALSARLEAEYEFRLTQRLMLQPRLELKAAASDDREVGVGSGLSSATAGLRLRYEIAREFAPYAGLSWSRAFGTTGDLAEDRQQTRIVAGVRFWF